MLSVVKACLSPEVVSALRLAQRIGLQTHSVCSCGRLAEELMLSWKLSRIICGYAEHA